MLIIYGGTLNDDCKGLKINRACPHCTHEWVITGELEDPFPQETLDKLKKIIEEKCSLILHH